MAQALSTLSTYANRGNVYGLRELGVYELPDGRQYVASALYARGYRLYPSHSWASYGEAEYTAEKDGRLTRRGAPTPWSVWDLKDTGKTTTYPAPIIQ